ncbi:MAG: response regulator [Pseudohongiella sp.]|nr:response regulator [Pseudohongiella sp.]
MNAIAVPVLDSVFPLYLMLDKHNRVKFISHQLMLEIGNDCLGQRFGDWFIVKRPVFTAHVPDISLLGRQLFLFITQDGGFAMRGQLLSNSQASEDVTMVITPWLTWMQENRPDRALSPKCFPVADAQLELQLYLNTQQMMMDDMNNVLLDLQAATDKAVAASSVKSKFVNHISHELRTPLNGILSAAELLKHEPASQHVQQLISVIGKSSEALLGIINQILYYSQISSGNLTLAIKEFDPAQLCRDVLDITTVLAKQHGIQIRLSLKAPLADRVSADAVRIHNVLLNLVGNAIKHCDGADVLIGVSMQSSKGSANHKLRFEVQDSGPGVPLGDRARIFEPFATVGNQKKFKESASGLGLTIVKSEVELMGGNIGVSDTPTGKGSLFWFDVPVSQSSITFAEDQVNTSHVNLSGTVLVVDDNQINLQLCKLQIQKFGLQADSAESGARAVELAAHNQYQLILMDIQMPDMNGQEATHLIRQMSHNLEVPIIAWTANACEEEAKTYISAGFSDTLIKPVSNQSLRSVLEKWIGRD